MRGHTEERSIPRSSLQQLPVASVIAESGRTRLLSSATLVSLGLERVILVGNHVGDCDYCRDDFNITFALEMAAVRLPRVSLARYWND
jgi:hypothetical protein